MQENFPNKILNQKKIVLFFTYGYSLRIWDDAGILKRDLQLYEELAKQGYQTTFITYGREDEQQFLPTGFGFRALTRPYRLSEKWFSRLSPIIYQSAISSCDVIKTHQVQGAISGVISKFLFRKPYIARCGYLKSVFAEMEGESESMRKRLAFEERLAFRFADIVCVPSQAEADYASQNYGLPDDKFRVCPNWVDVELFSPADKTPDKFTVIFVARFVEKKGPDILLEASRGINGLKVILIGGGPMKARLVDLISENGLDAEVHGRVPNKALPELLQQASVYALPTHHEGGSPKTLLEAMACGLPIISTDGFGVDEVFQDGVEGIKVRVGDVEGLRKAILTIKDNPEMAKSLGKNGRKRVLKTYSVERAVEREITILRELDL